MRLDLTKKATSLEQVRRVIQKKYPKLNIHRSSGYYYFFSDDELTANFLAQKYCVSVYVYSVKDLTLAQWLREADEVMGSKGQV